MAIVWLQSAKKRLPLLLLLLLSRGFFRLWLGRMMRSRWVWSRVMDSRRVRSLVVDSRSVRSLMVDSLSVRSLMVDSLSVRSLMVDSLSVRSRSVGSRSVRSRGVRSCRVGSRVAHRSVVDSCGVCSGVGLNHGVRTAVIYREVLVRVVSSFLFTRALRSCCLDMTIVRCRLFSGCGSRVGSTWAVKADVIIDSTVVDPCTVDVGVMDDGGIHAPGRCVIAEDVAIPTAAVETGSVIAEAVINTPVKPNVGTPITAVPTIEAVPKTPVAGGPKVSRLGHLYPVAGNPEIAVISVGPVARTPKISVRWAWRLVIDDEGRRRNCDRDSLSEKRERGRCTQQTREEDVSGFHQWGGIRYCEFAADSAAGFVD
jgi:hypothetical protein